MSTLDNIYTRLPIWGQHLAVSAFGLYWRWVRFGPGYREYVNEYLQRERFERADWQAWQTERIRQLLKHCVQYVPYYQRTWNSDEKQAALQGDLARLPLLGKEPIRQRPTDFLRADMQVKKPLIYKTSGSTGTPLATYWTAAEQRQSLALREARSARWAGVSFGLPRATFSGRIVEPDPYSRGPYYRFNLVERQVYFSAFHLRPDTASQYIQAIKRHKVEWMTGYAVSYYLLAKFVLDAGLDVPPIKAVVTTSEKVTPEMRAVMERAFHSKVFEEYSTVEDALFASECEYGKLHVSPDVAVVEILREDGSPCAPGEIGEVVTTNLSRNFQPFIRFRLGDLACWDDQPCACGRQMPVIKEVIGRIEDVVVGPDGRRMVRFHGIFVGQPHVREGQIVQEELDLIRVKIVPSSSYSAADDRDIAQRVQQRLGTDMRVVVECVEHIPRTASGKFQAVVSKLRNGFQE